MANISVDGTVTGEGPNQIGDSSTDTVGFFGATVTAQPASTAAVSATAVASISATQWGFSTSTQGDALVTLVRAIHANLISLGLKAS